MATVFLECWKCDQCGHRWIKGELWPAQCAKCRSRRWNADLDKEISRGDVALGHPDGQRTRLGDPDAGGLGKRDATRAVEQSPDTLLCNPPRAKPDIEALRAICRGDTGIVRIDPEVYEIPICGEKWWEDGERYECLMDKGHKSTKHGQKGMACNITE